MQVSRLYSFSEISFLGSVIVLCKDACPYLWHFLFGFFFKYRADFYSRYFAEKPTKSNTYFFIQLSSQLLSPFFIFCLHTLWSCCCCLLVDSLKTIIIFWIYAIIQFQKWHNKFPKTTNDKHGVQTRCQITVAISLVLLSILCVLSARKFLFVHIFGRFLRCRFQLTSLHQAHANQVKCL